ncbi:hypothetical protein E4U44_003100, partial [Claviceps purpurea]
MEFNEENIEALARRLQRKRHPLAREEDAQLKARERLKPSHRQDGTPFTHSAVLANSDNTGNRCCDDCVCNDDYMASMGLPCYHKIMSILETGSVLKTTDFD